MTVVARAQALVRRSRRNVERSRCLCNDALCIRVQALGVRNARQLCGASDREDGHHAADHRRAFLGMFDGQPFCASCFARLTDESLASTATWLNSRAADGSIISTTGSCTNCETTSTVYAALRPSFGAS